MDEPISKSLRITFLVHMIVALIFGAALFLIPGRTLTLINWQSEEEKFQTQEGEVTLPGTQLISPIITRQWGAALLALGFSSFLGWRASRREQVKFLVQTELVYCVLGVVAVLAVEFLSPPGILMARVVWLMAAILAAFAVAWGLALRR